MVGVKDRTDRTGERGKDRVERKGEERTEQNRTREERIG